MSANGNLNKLQHKQACSINKLHFEIMHLSNLNISLYSSLFNNRLETRFLLILRAKQMSFRTKVFHEVKRSLICPLPWTLIEKFFFLCRDFLHQPPCESIWTFVYLLNMIYRCPKINLLWHVIILYNIQIRIYWKKI